MYMPILKWRQGEYLAVGRTSEGVKDGIYPLFEIPIEQWDFENDAPAKSLDDHLKNVGRRLSSNWKARRCLFDSPILPVTTPWRTASTIWSGFSTSLAPQDARPFP